MRIYLLCDEINPEISDLKYLLDKHQINYIYSSPCKQILQTISPYCDMKDLQINIEYGLSINGEENLKNQGFYSKNRYFIPLFPLSKINNSKGKSKAVFNHFAAMYQKYESVNILLAANVNILSQILNVEDYEWPMGGLALGYDDSFCGNTRENDYRRRKGRQFKPINFTCKLLEKKNIILKIIDNIIENIEISLH